MSNYLEFNDMTLGCEHPCDALIAARHSKTDSGVWVISFLPEFGHLSQLQQALRISDEFELDANAVVTIRRKNTSVWLQIDEAKGIVSITRQHPGMEIQDFPIRASGKDKALQVKDHGDPHMICLCNGVFKICESGQTPQSCCS